MTDYQLIHDYLKALAKYLGRLDKADAEEVLKEIECHIMDVLDAAEADGQTVDIPAVLQGFGSPRELARLYVDHVLQGTPPPAGFKAIQMVKRGVTGTLYVGMAVFGYLTAFSLLLTGLYKLVSPRQVGVWSAADGNSFIVGMVESSSGQSQELLGWWYTPLALVLSMAIGYLTWRVLKGLKQG
ncbi:HAAS signaling domain-containing protein [Shewanella sp. GXUN23E]|uniref:HAAS signaling domain-containing protein n=1 Tax=Shewanella sp. GXUN23E TaxID=3422498 RepID=UPI003D7F0C6D